MSDIYKGELQDYEGNTIYPHSEADVIFCTDGETTQSKLNKYENALGNVTGVTDSLEVDDSKILVSAKALHKVNSSLDGCSFEQDGEDFYIVGADSVRKKLGNLNMKINLEIVSAIDTNPNGGYMGATSKAVLTITNGIPSISYSGGNSSGAWLNNAYWYGVTRSIKVASFEEI